MPATIPIQQILALTIAYYLVKKVKKNKTGHKQGYLFLVLKKCTFFAAFTVESS